MLWSIVRRRLRRKAVFWTVAGEFLDDILTMKYSSDEHALLRISQDSQPGCKIMYWRPVLQQYDERIGAFSGSKLVGPADVAPANATATNPPKAPSPTRHPCSAVQPTTTTSNTPSSKYAIYLQQIRSQVPSCILYSRQSTNP